jgi:hypothetical protein
MVGKCFYYDTFPNDEHLFVVVSPSLNREGWFLCVNITTKRDGSDTTCEVYQNEHPNLPKPVSVVVYGQARELPIALIQRLTETQQVPKMSDALLLRIQQAPLTDYSRLKKAFKNAIVAYLKTKEEHH